MTRLSSVHGKLLIFSMGKTFQHGKSERLPKIETSGDPLTLFGKFISNIIELIEMYFFQTHFMFIFPLDELVLPPAPQRKLFSSALSVSLSTFCIALILALRVCQRNEAISAFL